MSDCILLRDISCFCKLGVYEEEREHGQAISLDLELELDLSQAGFSDRLEDTLSYVDVSLYVQELARARPYHLIEHLCNVITEGLLAKFPKLLAVGIEIHKPVINARCFTGRASVKIRRSRQ